ncbi:MAG TPA: hypothetical protein VKS60_11410 [Stellaceae bacterium]|nr:hypothetical protein [Stellaceae bacterium]
MDLSMGIPGCSPNPDYGTGAYRRRIRLTADAGTVAAQLDDNYHALWSQVDHEGGVIRRVEGGFSRAPTTGCGSAGEELRAFIGRGIDLTLPELSRAVDPRCHCTHMLDLTVLAIREAARGEGRRRYEIVVPDAVDGRVTVDLLIDDRRVVSWQVHAGMVVAPAEVAGRKLLRGFLTWAFAHLDGEALEQAVIIQKGYFVSQARRNIIDDRPRPLTEFPDREGVCHAYSQPRFGWAIQEAGNSRDFSAGVVEAPPPDPSSRPL